MITAVVFDLDGVVRQFDPDPDLDTRHGLPPGTTNAAALSPALLSDVTTGRITRAEWIRRIGRAIDAPEAAEEWGRMPFHADEAVLGLVDRLRAQGRRTAILTNGTDTIPAELASLGIDRRFDRVFNSATIGHAKPDRRAFEHVLEALGLRPADVFFTDDSSDKLAGAEAVGMRTHLFDGADGLETALLRARAL